MGEKKFKATTKLEDRRDLSGLTWIPAAIDEIDERAVILLRFWRTAMAVARRDAPELLPYVEQLQPRKEWRLGRVVRPGFGR
jgi:hypothetical protein